MSKFQIIIPTMFGREKYLYYAIKSCLEQEYDNFEVIISNNGGSKEIFNLVRSFGDNRLLYFETESFLPMAVHWEFALSKSAAEILTIIGDDDALMPFSLSEIAKICKKNNGIECITHSPGQYYWPDYYDPQWQNKYQIPPCNGMSEILNPKEVFKKVAEFKLWYGKLPNLYHGFVKRTAIERIRETQGLIFQRIYPDVYSDLALSLTISSYAHLDKCLSIGGQGAKSNGAEFFTGKTSGILEKIPSYLEPKYYHFNIQIQLYEYVFMAMEKFVYEEKIELSWFRFFTKTIVEALSRDQSILEGSLRELRRIVNKDSPAKVKLPANAILSALNSSLLCKSAQKLIELRKIKISRAWKSALCEYGVENILDLVKKLSSC